MQAMRDVQFRMITADLNVLGLESQNNKNAEEKVNLPLTDSPQRGNLK
jgi:hypothetical protein